MVRKKETVEEYMKRGGKVKTIPYVKDYSIDYFSKWKVSPEMMSTKMVGYKPLRASEDVGHGVVYISENL